MRTVRILSVARLTTALAGVLGMPLYGAPTIGTTAVTPTSIPVGVATQITVTALITDPSVIAGGVNLQRLDASGVVTAILGILHDDGKDGDAVAGDHIYTLQVTLTESAVGPVSLRVSAAFQGLLTRVFSGLMTVNVVGTAAPQVTITSPANLSFLNLSPTTVTGTVSDPKATVTVNGLPAPVGNGIFSASIPLAEGPNIITATATSSSGVSTASIQVTLDTTPPHVTITSPPDQFVTTDASISVSGNVNDIVVGTVNDQQAQVTVNGIQAQVANRTFLATNVPLNLGANVIQAVARDRSGNPATTQITVTRQRPTQVQIKLISGNNQTATIGSILSAPLVVALVDPNGNPIPNKPVIFKVTQDDGLVSATGSPAAASAMATTNAQGQAQVQWTLGMRSGAGGNTVEAYSVGYSGTAIFTATGTPGTPGKIVIDTGNNQIGAVNQPLPKPLIAVVIDQGNNRLANVLMTFTAKQGGGNFGGQPSVTVASDSDGRVAAILTLGFQEGNSNNLVEANFPSNQGFPASFTASGRAPGNAANTSISGVVLDNSNQPIPGVTIRAVLTNAVTASKAAVSAVASVQTNGQGQFTIAQAPVGLVKLMVDGSTATRPGTFPTLEYDLVTVAGRNNVVGQPIYLLPLSANQLCVTATTGGGTLTIPEAPGFSLTFAPGQVTFPGNTQTGCVSVTVVHTDKVPMSPGFGQQPRFIVTIQPTGALFNPPAAITLPNVDGLRPREVTEMYSYDHDISSFVAIGTGVVSNDGMVIRSSPGVGVLKAGWHCGGNPNANGSVADCAPCNHCINDACTADPSQNGNSCTAVNTYNVCVKGGTCDNGACMGGMDLPDGTSCNSGGQVMAVCLGGKCTGQGNQCPVPCNQGGPCTVPECVNGVCQYPHDPNCDFCQQPNNAGLPCGPCMTGATCQNGTCQGGTASTGSCGPCMSGGTCSASGQCIGGTPVSGPCSSGGSQLGMCVSGQCQGMGNNQCPVSCKPANVCMAASCVNGACAPPTILHDNAMCCGGQPFDPVTQGCFNPPNNPIDKIYDRSLFCDVEIADPLSTAGYLVPKNVNGTDPFQLWCPQRLQNQLPHHYDGCSLPVAGAVALGLIVNNKIVGYDDYTGDVNEPIMGVKFSNILNSSPGWQPTAACDVHDKLYQTCSINPTGGPPLDSDKTAADSQLLQLAIQACDAALPPNSHILDECHGIANIYYKGVTYLGESSFIADQKLYCQCCP